MGRFKIEFSKVAAKNYRKLPKNYKVLVDLSLAKLVQGLPIDIKPIVGEKNTYRIRVGKYRILLIRIDEIILITRISSRGNAYK